VYFSRALLALALATFALFSCAKPDPVRRVAVLRFQNLSSAASDQDWIGRAISEEVSGQLEGTRHSAIISFAAIQRLDEYLGGQSAHSAAVAAGANKIVTGFYVLRNGRLSITAVMESLPGGSQKQVFAGSGAVEDLLHLCEEVARNIDEEAKPPITGSPRALRSYALGLDTPDRATALFTEAIQLDPDFGPPYVALAQIALAKHDTAAFTSIFDAARARSGIASVDRAVLNLDDAELHAAPSTRVDALAALVRITPADPFHLRELADAELEINRYAEAAEHYRRLATLLPSDAEPVNRMGYALMYAGDEPAALKAFEDFRRLDHDSANSFDSMGDGHFFFNRFAEAEQDYLAAYQRDPTLLEGTELIKVAWTRLMRNDRKGALQFVDRYLKGNDRLGQFRAALVEKLADRPQELRAYLTSPDPDIRAAATKQLALFDDPASLSPPLTDVPAWRKLAEESSPMDWWTRTIYARVLAQAGQSMESAKYARFTPYPQPLRAVSYDQFWYPWILSARRSP
jgi:tetratricopeptide (TPR) repeat protein